MSKSSQSISFRIFVFISFCFKTCKLFRSFYSNSITALYYFFSSLLLADILQSGNQNRVLGGAEQGRPAICVRGQQRSTSGKEAGRQVPKLLLVIKPERLPASPKEKKMAFTLWHLYLGVNGSVWKFSSAGKPPNSHFFFFKRSTFSNRGTSGPV